MKPLGSFLRGLGYPIKKPNVGTEALYAVVWLAERAQDRVAKVLKPYGLTPGKLNYLMVVKHIGRAEGLSQQEIARHLLLNKRNVTNDLDVLEGKGWIVRAPSSDRRSHRIKITARGDQLLNRVWPVYDGAVRRFTEFVPPAHQRQIVEILTRWRDAVRE